MVKARCTFDVTASVLGLTLSPHTDGAVLGLPTVTMLV